LPVPESPEPFPEYLTKSEDSGSFRVLGASVRGKKHKYDGSNGDDRFETTSADKVCIAAAADGAGSRRFSRIGAKVSVEAVCEALKISFETLISETPAFYEILSGDMTGEEFTSLTQKIAAIMRSAVITAYDAVIKASLERKTLPEFENPALYDFASTLLMTAAVPANDGETLVISLTIGDGAVAVFTDDEKAPLTIISAGDKGEFAGETEFLISENVRTDASLKNRTRITRRKIKAVLLMTDGVSEDYFPYYPELLRLLPDLRLNRILPPETEENKTDKIISPPVATPWINDPDVEFTIQYSKNLMKDNGLTLEELYFDKVLQNASRVAEPLDKNPAEALAIWLDSYVERGSFDDRTLVAILP
jgi:hypothetical protein